MVLVMCPVCGRKVGAWRKDGVHPKCRGKMPVDVYAGGVKIATLTEPAVLKLPDGDEYVIGKPELSFKNAAGEELFDDVMPSSGFGTGFVRLSQKQRDAILRRMNAKDR